MENMENKKKEVADVYAEGVFFPNTKARLGGTASIIIYPDGATDSFSLSYADTDTLRMKITAVRDTLDGLAGLVEQKTLKPGTHVKLMSDSDNVVKPITLGWLKAWKSRGWRTSTGKPVGNTDLLEEMLTRIGQLEQSSITLSFVSIDGIKTPTFVNPGLDLEQAKRYHKQSNDLAVEAMRRLERELKNKQDPPDY